MNAFTTTGPSTILSGYEKAAALRSLQNPLRVQPINSFNSAIPKRQDKDKTMRIGGRL